jgi:rhodanese-related sulfurtransferase
MSGTIDAQTEHRSFTVKSKSRITEITAAHSSDALEHFSQKLKFETDCADVYAAFVSGTVDFVLVDVRSSQLYRTSHVPGAINIPTLAITEERIKEYPPNLVFVVYCAGPHCNGANKAAIRLAKLERPVKEMIGGVMGWVDEGFNLDN